ncbi:MAG: M3 family metallopeptidase [Candidatus Thorarchaeota archaeon]|jgi:thimet oligopeptidase
MTEPGTIRKPDWTIDPAKIRSSADEAIEAAKEKLNEIAKTSPGEESLKTLQDFEEVGGAAGEALVPLVFLKYISGNKAQRDVADEVEKDAQKFENEIWGRKDLYEVFARLEPIMDSLDPDDKTLLDKTLKEFRHRGAALDDEKRKEFLEIANNISVLESEFGRVLNEITTTVPCAVEELDGVPPFVYENLKKDGDKYLLTLDYPVVVPVRDYATNPETRKKVLIPFYARGGKENSTRLSDAIALRERLAKLLDHSNYAEYTISRKMAKTPQRVIDFMYDLKSKLTPLMDKEMVVLKGLKAREQNLPIDEVSIEIWDLFYYHEMLMREKYAVDQNEVKKYFPADAVIEGVLRVYQKVLDLDFEESKEPNSWHEDVREFIVTDKTNGKRLGVFHLDLFPREGKFKHYAVFDFLSRRVKDGEELLPICAMVSNYQKPTEDQPSLFNHSEVETFFHEFGHLMHVISNQSKYASFSLDGVLPDFIETPSMMFQNWAWKEEVLNDISGHFEDPNKKLPSDLIKRLIDAKLVNVGAMYLRQVCFSLVDMTYHTEGAEETTDLFNKMLSEITTIQMPEETRVDAGFGHLMNSNYVAGYYSYLWSQAYAEDVFTKFEQNGFMDTKTGVEYRNKILAPGGSLDPDEMVKSFLGREMNTDAFMKSLGLGKK